MEHSTEKTQHKTSKPTYNSDPFGTTWVAIKKVLHNNGNTLFALVFFEVLLVLLAIMIIGALAVSFFAYAVNHGWISAPVLSYILSRFTGLDIHMSDLSILFTWILGAPLLVVTIALMQALIVRLTVSSALDHEIGFSQILKKSLERTPILIGWYGITLLGLVISVVLLAISTLLGPISVVFIFAALLLSLYLFVVFVFAPYIIVDEGIGPIKALKKSLLLTKGHLTEVVGIISTAALVSLVPKIVLNFVGVGPNGSVLSIITDIFALLSVFFIMMAAVLSNAGIATRFVELRRLKAGELSPVKTSPLNYFALLVFIVFAQMIARFDQNSGSAPANPAQPTKQIQQSPYQSDEGGNPATDGQDTPNFN